MGGKFLLSLFIAAFVFSVQWAGLKEVSAGTTTRVSVASDGTEGDWVSSYPSISSDGRYVAFDSLASNLVGGDTNGNGDVFVHDRETGTTTRVSVASDGTQANKGSSYPSISSSSDGRYVAFQSTASNLEGGDTNGRSDVFLHCCQTGITMRVSIATDGTQGNGNSYHPSISSDGAYVAFESAASNLVDGDTNSTGDIFVHYWHYTTTTRVSVASDGTEANDICYYPSISSDGRYVAFHSAASNLVVDDTNGHTDVFLHDCQTAITTRVSVASDAAEGNDDSFNPSISSDGRYVAFCSNASNLVSGDTNGRIDVFVHDRYTATTTRASVASEGTQGNDVSSDPSISSDGRYVAFESNASNLVVGDTNSKYDTFVHDRQTRTTIRVSVASDGTQGNDFSWNPSISSDSSHGVYVAFESYASNLVVGDTNSYRDVFVHSEAVPPVPDIKANGSDGPVGIAFGNALSVTIELDPGEYPGYQADWWVLADAPFGWYYYDSTTKQWLPGFRVSYQGVLFALTPPVEVLNTSGLPTGNYIFYFGVDGIRNGRLDMPSLYHDSVAVNITP